MSSLDMWVFSNALLIELTTRAPYLAQADIMTNAGILDMGIGIGHAGLSAIFLFD